MRNAGCHLVEQSLLLRGLKESPAAPRLLSITYISAEILDDELGDDY